MKFLGEENNTKPTVLLVRQWALQNNVQQAAGSYQDKRQYKNATAPSFKLLVIFLSSNLLHPHTICSAHRSYSFLPDTSFRHCQNFLPLANYSQRLSEDCCAQFHSAHHVRQPAARSFILPLVHPCLFY